MADKGPAEDRFKLDFVRCELSILSDGSVHSFVSFKELKALIKQLGESLIITDNDVAKIEAQADNEEAKRRRDLDYNQYMRTINFR